MMPITASEQQDVMWIAAGGDMEHREPEDPRNPASMIARIVTAHRLSSLHIARHAMTRPTVLRPQHEAHPRPRARRCVRLRLRRPRQRRRRRRLLRRRPRSHAGLLGSQVYPRRDQHQRRRQGHVLAVHADGDVQIYDKNAHGSRSASSAPSGKLVTADGQTGQAPGRRIIHDALKAQRRSSSMARHSSRAAST